MSGRLYRGFSAAELDRQYDARATVEDITPFLDDYCTLSAAARRDLPCLRNIAYGPRPEESLDLFPAGDDAPLLVFIHGGYWRLLSKDESAFMAKPFVAAGVAVAAVNYGLAPATALDEIVRQVRAATAHLWHEADAYGLDRRRFFVAGSSAGGHLAAMLLPGDWQSGMHLPGDLIRGGILASGLYDLAPLRHCAPNDWLNLDAAIVHRNSPLHHLSTAHGCPLLITWAGSETDEFKRQSRDFAAAWRHCGSPALALEVADRNHFNIITDLADPMRLLTRYSLHLIETGQLP